MLAHLLECSYLAALIALELGAAADIARRAALLHDIGKAADQGVEGTHAQVGAGLARRYGESEAVAHAIEAHHDEVEPNTVEAVVRAGCRRPLGGPARGPRQHRGGVRGPPP